MKKTLILLLASLMLVGAELKIADKGAACAGILIPENACPVVRKAASELADYLKKLTGAEFAIGSKSTFAVNFRLGFGDASAFLPDEYVINISNNNIDIYGKDSNKPFSWQEYCINDPWKGTLHAVYQFLDSLGVRWVQPGLEYVPKKETLVISETNIHRKPAFASVSDINNWNFYKTYKDCKEYGTDVDDVFSFMLKNGCKSRFFLYGGHTEYSLGLHEDPNWLSDQTRLQLDKDGNRQPQYSCWTHPDVLATWLRAADGYFSGKSPEECGFDHMSKRIPKEFSNWPFPFVCKDEFMIDPMDMRSTNDGRCCCSRCNEFRKNNPCPDDTDIMWNVIGKVAEDVKAKHPGKYIATLVYPPKQQLPKQTLPDNVRVRICLSGPKIVLEPDLFEAEIKTIHDWWKLTGNKPPLWVYHCVHHGDSMPHLVEIYPHLIAKYIRGVRNDCAGMFMEIHSSPLNYTRFALDAYIFRRFMNNPDLDVDAEIASYCRVVHGPAADDAIQFYNRLEELFVQFWRQTVSHEMAKDIVSPWGRKNEEYHRKLWELCYTPHELANLSSMLQHMEEKTKGTQFERQTYLLKTYLFAPILQSQVIERYHGTEMPIKK